MTFFSRFSLVTAFAAICTAAYMGNKKSHMESDWSMRNAVKSSPETDDSGGFGAGRIDASKTAGAFSR